MRRCFIAFALAGAVGVLAGCAPEVLPSSGPVAFRPRSDAQMDALLTGTLRIDDGCVWVDAELDDFIPAFQVGEARFESGELVYGDRYSDGDVIGVGGGPTNNYSGAAWYVPSGCPDLELWAASEPLEAG